MRFLMTFVPLVFLCSCATERLVPAEAGSFRSPKLQAAAAKIVVVPNQDVGEATEVLGVIDVHEPTGGQQVALQYLKGRAALLGADAVLGVEFHHEGAKTSTDKDVETHLSGVAVRRRALLADRPYRVLGLLKVEAEMEHEDEGMTKLRAKAGALGADLLVDVQFRHGEGGGEKTELSGIAIKYDKK